MRFRVVVNLQVFVTVTLALGSVLSAQTQTLDSSDVQNEQANQADVTAQVAQSPAGQPIEIGRRLKITSKILQQEREYLVYLPSSYNSDRHAPKSYPVLFLFDGNIQFHAVTGMVDYMGGLGGQIPEMIVVGIPHQNRTKELTPTQTTNDFRKGKTTQTLADSGGGDVFLEFVTEELIPKIDSDYRTRPFRILFGHSFGGLLAAHAFLKADDSFQAFILADPSLWWDDRILVQRFEKQIADGNIKHKSAIYISRVATYRSPDNEETQQGFNNVANSIDAFGNLLGSTKTVRHRVRQFDVETHTSVPIPTLYHGLLHTFDGYEPPPEVFLSSPEKIMQHFDIVSRAIGLKVKPGEPLIEMWGNAFLNYDEEFRRFALPLFELNVANYPASPDAFANLASAKVVWVTTKGQTSHSKKHWNLIQNMLQPNQGSKHY